MIILRVKGFPEFFFRPPYTSWAAVARVGACREFAGSGSLSLGFKECQRMSGLHMARGLKSLFRALNVFRRRRRVSVKV